MTFGAFISAKRKELRLTLRETAKHLGIACGYLSDVEQSRRPAPEGDFVERISRYLGLSKTDHERLLDLAAKSRNRISADLPEYIMQIVAEMAQIFEVSKQAMQIRLQSHNLM